jgi:1-acyl-sn-glycerol-3-phosphate acyltransferase
MLRVALRLSAIGLLTVALIPLQALSVAFRWPSRRWIPVFYHRIVCKLIGVRIEVVGRCDDRRPLLIVANHTSWLDIPIITAVAPVVFIAKSEIAGWPLFGLLAKLQRSVFVDRQRPHKTAEVNHEIANRLVDGDPVVLFGEGTSSDGNRVLPFRTALIGAARFALAKGSVDAVTVQPLSIAFARHHGLPLGRHERRALAWYGGIELWPHLIEVLRRGAVDVIVTWGEPMAFKADSDRKRIAAELESQVRRITAAARRGQLPALPASSEVLPVAARETPIMRGQGGLFRRAPLSHRNSAEPSPRI